MNLNHDLLRSLLQMDIDHVYYVLLPLSVSLVVMVFTLAAMLKAIRAASNQELERDPEGFTSDDWKPGDK
jgi:hypothetical protein